MRKLFFLIITTLFLLAGYGLTAQSYRPPKPFMTKAMYRVFIRMHFEYPKKALRNNEQGRFALHFTSDETGKIIRKNITESVSATVDSAALRLFDKIIWLPAMQDGTAIPGEGNFSLKYKIKKFEKLTKKRGYKYIVLPYQPVDFSCRIYKSKMLDKQPKPILGQYKSLKDYIYSQLSYPAEARKFSLTGTVQLSFVIETNGLPSNIHIVNGVGGGCTEEAITILENLRWMPGIKAHKAVRVTQQLKISFALNRRKSSEYIPSQNTEGGFH